MRTISRGVLIAIVVCVVPFFANALTASDLQAQIQALLAQVAALQQQLQAMQSTPTTPVASSRACPTLSRTLTLGAQGADVLSLQQFLQAQNLLGVGAAQGYFDVTTEVAVQRLQVQYGIVVSGTPATTGYGSVGPRTRALIALNCGVSSNPNVPSTPSCPIAPPPATICSVGWQANTDANGCTTSYKCSIPLPQPSSCPFYQPPICTGGTVQSLGNDANGCSRGYQCIPNACTTTVVLACPAGTHDQVGPNCSHSCVPNTPQPTTSFSASPTSGNAPLSVTFNTGSGGVLDFGDGQSVSVPPGTCSASGSTSGGISSGYCSGVQTPHTYSFTGTYTATLSSPAGYACPIGSSSSVGSGCTWRSAQILGTVTITVGGSVSGGFEKPFLDAGCTVTSKSSGGSVYYDCNNATSIKAFGCTPGGFIVGQEFGMPMMACSFWLNNPDQVDQSQYFRCRFGLARTCTSYAAYQNGSFRLIKNPAALLSIVGSIQNEAQAKQLVLMSQGVVDSFTTTDAGTFSSVPATRSGNVFTVTVYRDSGCLSDQSYKVVFQVSTTGAITEISSTQIYTNTGPKCVE